MSELNTGDASASPERSPSAEHEAGVAVYNGFDINDPRLDRDITFARGKDRFDTDWTPYTIPVWQAIEEFGKHKIGTKDGKAVVLARMIKGKRLKPSVIEVTALGYDDDSGTPSDELDKLLEESGYLATRYTTHSHKKTHTDIKRDNLHKFAPDADCITDDDATIPDELIRDYLRSNDYDERIVATACYAGRDHTKEGPIVRIEHAPWEKNRMVLFLSEPFVIAREGKTRPEAEKRWRRFYLGFARKLGLTRIDKTGADINRLFNLPRHDRGAEYEVAVFGGDFVDWRKVESECGADFEAIADAAAKQFGNRRKTKTEAGVAILDWYNARADGFKIKDLFQDRCPDIIKGTASGSGIAVTCAFEANHTDQDPNDTACFAMNAGDDGYEYCIVKCLHNGCSDKTTPDQIGAWVAAGRITLDDLWNPEYDAVERLTVEKVTERLKGKKLDANEIRTILNEIADVPNDVERESLFVAAYEAVPRPQQPLVTKAKKAAAKAWAEKRREQRKATKTDAQAETFVFDENEVDKLVAAINAKCAIIPIGNERRFAVYDSEADDYVFLRKRDAEIEFAQYRLVVETEKGTKEVPGFNVWLKDQNRKAYARRVFRPAMDHGPNDLNLFGGFPLTPAVGDWSLMRAHLFENVCQRNQEHFDYLLAWMSQMFCEPGRKPGVSLVLRGLQGVGKSKLGEWLRRMVGMRYSRTIDKPDHIAGKFNALIENAIFVLIEEAPFAGDPKQAKAFTHLITNHDLTYEEKGIESRNGENFSRFMIVTNAEWAAPVSGDDRRYFVLDVGDAHKEDKAYFAALDWQMENGGAAAMIYDLMQMNVRMADMPAPPMTDAKREQVELSMKDAEAWLADVLGEGRFPFLDPEAAAIEWPTDGGEVQRDDIAASYRDFVPGYRGRPATSSTVGKFLRKWFPQIGDKRGTDPFGNRPWLYVLPPLAEAREAFRARMKGFEFHEEVTEPETAESPSAPAAAPATPHGPAKVEDLAQHRQEKKTGKRIFADRGG